MLTDIKNKIKNICFLIKKENASSKTIKVKSEAFLCMHTFTHNITKQTEISGVKISKCMAEKSEALKYEKAIIRKARFPTSELMFSLWHNTFNDCQVKNAKTPGIRNKGCIPTPGR